jgi:lysophospholipase L1-like esterase
MWVVRSGSGERLYHTTVAPRIAAMPLATWRSKFLSAVLVLILALVGDYVAGSLLGTLRSPKPDAREKTAALRPYTWARQYFEEFRRAGYRYHPFDGWEPITFRGRYINVANGRRRTYKPVVSRKAATVEVYFLGGSTAWGSGQRDEFTIPSYLARLAERDGIDVRITNLGRSGFVSRQEALLLQRLLASGEQPDLAVMYDGYNDIYLQMLHPGTAPSHTQQARLAELIDGRRTGPRAVVSVAWREYTASSLALKLARRVKRVRHPYASVAPVTTVSDETLARNAIAVYTGSVEIATEVGRARNVETAFFWQPFIGTKVLRRGERDLPVVRVAQAERVYALATPMLPPGIHDLTRSLDTVEEAVMIDDVHTNEAGARAIAEAMYEHLKPRLIEISARKSSR